jgi:hypothetical protein
MAKLWFQNSNGEERVIADADTTNDVFTAIRNFLDDHNYKSYYTRIWIKNNRTFYDVGSWSEFFIWDNVPAGENNE